MNEEKVKILFGKKVRHLRNNLNLTQFALGELINVNQRQITLIEAGKSFPSLKSIIKLAEVFSCDIKDLFNFENLQETKILKDNINKTIEKLNSEQIKVLYTIIKELI